MAKNKTKSQSTASVFERIGGMNAVNAAVEIFYKKVLADDTINHFFKNTDMENQRGKQKAFLAMAFGGLVKYTGKDMRQAHAKLVENGLNEDHFNAVAGHLVATLKELNVPKKELNEIVNIALSVKSDVLGLNENMASTKSNSSTEVKENGKAASKSASQDYSSVDFLQVMEGSILSIVMIDQRGTIEYFNNAAEKLWGYQRDEVIGQNVKILTPDDIRPQHDGYLSAYNKTGKKNVMGGAREVHAKTKSGDLIPIFLTLSESESNGVKKYSAFIQDITEKKRLEAEVQNSMEEMRAQEEELRQNMEEITATQEEMERKQLEMNGTMNAINSTSAFVEFDIDGNVIAANELLLKTMKYSIEEIEGKHHRMFCDSQYTKTKEYENFWNELRAGKAQVGEFKRVAKDGSIVWLQASYTPVVNGQGKIDKFMKLASDITANKLVQAEAEKERLRNSKTLEQAVDSIIAINSDKIITFINPKAVEMFGFTAEEVMGQNVKMLVPIEHRANHDNYVNANMTTGINKVVGSGRDLEMTRKDGSKFWGNLSLSKVELDGELSYTAFIKDITEQRNDRERMAQILEQAVDSVITIDENKIITFINKSGEDMFGFSRNEVLGQNVKMLVPVEHRANHDNYVNANMTTGINKVVGSGRDLEMTRKDGSKFWGNLGLSKVEVDGKFQYTAFIKDITSAKHNDLAYEEVIKAIGELNLGNFDFQLNIDGLTVDPAVEKVLGDIEDLKGNLGEIIAAVNNVVLEAGEKGNLNARLSLDTTQGSWKQLVDSINILLQSIAEPVLEFNSIISEMANGDLSKKFEMKTNGDLKNMAEALNKAISSLNGLLSNISENVNVVSDSATNTLSKSESMKSNTDEMASAISQMAKGAQDQAQKTDESSKLAEEVLTSAEDMESKSDIIYKAAEKGVSSCENGLKIIKNLVENMGEINESAGLTNESIKILTERAEEIGRTLNVITDIAAQTNLLALNAAIEAARAGEAGRGFAVVAEEIRKLAEDSRKSAVEIEKIVGDVQKDTQSASKAIETMTSSVKDGSTATKDAESIFEEIAESSTETLNFSGAIKDATVKQKVSLNTVAKNIEQIVVVAEETAAGTEEIATSSQELNNGMQEVAVSSNQLTKIASDLKADISKFKLK